MPNSIDYIANIIFNETTLSTIVLCPVDVFSCLSLGHDNEDDEEEEDDDDDKNDA